MQQFILNEKLSLSFEPADKKVRLVILQSDEELVCRKETLKNLQHFLSASEAHIFKGRLQLSKKEDIIEVLVKQKPIGIISSSNFKNVLEMMSN